MNLKNILPWKKNNRAVTTKNDGDPVAQLQNGVHNLFDEFFGHSLFQGWDKFGQSFMPKIDVSETDKDIRISAELPGLDEKDLELTVAGNVLTIKGQKSEEHEEEKGDRWHSERSYGYFERNIELPESADFNKIDARFKKGVLKVSVTKKPGARSSRKKIELLQE